MWPTIRDGFKAFFTDKAYFASRWDKWVAKVRGAIMLLGGAIAIPGTGFAEKIQTVVPPKWAPYVGLALMGASLMLRAGDKTPASVKALAVEQDAKVTP